MPPAYDPAISGSIVSGLAGQMDPTTEAYAASYELRTDALALHGDGITDPTVLQTRAVYQFGGNVGPDVAAASASPIKSPPSISGRRAFGDGVLLAEDPLQVQQARCVGCVSRWRRRPSCSIVLDLGGVDCGGWRRVRIRG